MHGTTVVVTWKGSTCSVCHHCKESGHWTEKCTPTHRTLAAQKRLKKLEPSPLPQKTPQPTESMETPTQPTENKGTPAQPAVAGSSKSVQKEAEAPKTQPKPDKGKQKEQPAKKSSAAKEEEAMRESRKALAEEGFYTLSSGDETPPQDKGKKVTGKKVTESKSPETSTRQYTQGRQVRTMTVTSISTRARSKGTLTDYILYLLKIGQASVPQANSMIESIKPQDFIEITKPGMTKQLYANFGKFVDKRKNNPEADTIKELRAYKVSIPDYLIPENENYVDTSVPPKKTGSKRKRRKSESTVAAESSAEDRSETAQPITSINVQYIDEDGKDCTFKLKYTQNMRVNTLAKAIKKKRKITSEIRLIRKSDGSILDLQKTALEAELSNEEVIILDRPVEQDQDEEMEGESETIQVRFLQKGTSRVINIDFAPSDTAVNMYMTIAQHIRKRHTAITLYRSDGTPVNRYTTVEGLQLRHFEILREGNTEVIPMDINWIERKK